eukprot:1161517-Pelagomonas_calceolata.AAC.5
MNSPRLPLKRHVPPLRLAPHCFALQDALESLAADSAAMKNPRLPRELARAISRRRMMESKGLGKCECMVHHVVQADFRLQAQRVKIQGLGGCTKGEDPRAGGNVAGTKGEELRAGGNVSAWLMLVTGVDDVERGATLLSKAQFLSSVGA